MTVLAQDSFNRADSSTSLGTADVGGTWQATSGAFGISSNQAYHPVTLPDQFATLPISTVDAEITATKAAGTIGIMGFAGRWVDANNFYYCYYAMGTGRIGVGKAVAGVGSLITEVGGSIADGGTLRMRIEGTSLRIYTSGSLVIDTTDSSVTGAGAVGIYGSSQSAQADWRIDDYVATDLVLPPSSHRRSHVAVLRRRRL